MGHERSQHTQTYRNLAKEHAHRVRTRLMVLAAAGVLALGLLPRLRPATPLLVALAVGLLGWHGRRKDQPLIDAAVMSKVAARKLTADMVVRAFVAAKLCKEDDPITFAQPIARHGTGWAAARDRPYRSQAWE